MEGVIPNTDSSEMTPLGWFLVYIAPKCPTISCDRSVGVSHSRARAARALGSTDAQAAGRELLLRQTLAISSAAARDHKKGLLYSKDLAPHN